MNYRHLSELSRIKHNLKTTGGTTCGEGCCFSCLIYIRIQYTSGSFTLLDNITIYDRVALNFDGSSE